MFKGIRFLREVKVKANWTKRFQSHIYHDESGITGLETAIILIAFIVVAAVFAFTVMTTGLFSSERAKTVALSGLSEAASSLTLKGPVSAEAHNIGQPYGQVPVKLVFQVGLSMCGGEKGKPLGARTVTSMHISPALGNLR
jgi:flagellin-like protein|tara:strand:- start:557 stop:979 length:423 start_codon:yes stop_codon:yes gene_type:complete